MPSKTYCKDLTKDPLLRINSWMVGPRQGNKQRHSACRNDGILFLLRHMTKVRTCWSDLVKPICRGVLQVVNMAPPSCLLLAPAQLAGLTSAMQQVQAQCSVASR